MVLTDGAGRPLDGRRTVSGARLGLELRVTPALLAAPPAELVVHLAGAPDAHALLGADGTTLPEGRELEVALRPHLEDGDRPPRLRTVGGRPAGDGPVPLVGPLVLVVDGVLDPATITPAACPLFPVASGLTLEPVRPAVTWTLVGGRTTLVLTVDDPRRPLELRTRRLGLADLEGRPLEPLLVVELTSS